MPRILYADNDYTDIELERSLFAPGRPRGGRGAVQDRGRRDPPRRGAASAILLQYAPISARVVAALPELGIVSRIGAGYDTVDTEACEKAGVWVAQLAGLRRRRGRDARAGARARRRCATSSPTTATSGRGSGTSCPRASSSRPSLLTLGIVGLGRIGKRMAHISRNVFKRVVAFDPYLIDGDFPGIRRARAFARRARRAGGRRHAAHAAHARDARHDRRDVLRRAEAGRVLREHRARRDREHPRSRRRARRRSRARRRARRAAGGAGAPRLAVARASRASSSRRTPRSIRSRRNASCGARRPRIS